MDQTTRKKTAVANRSKSNPLKRRKEMKTDPLFWAISVAIGLLGVLLGRYYRFTYMPWFGHVIRISILCVPISIITTIILVWYFDVLDKKNGEWTTLESFLVIVASLLLFYFFSACQKAKVNLREEKIQEQREKYILKKRVVKT